MVQQQQQLTEDMARCSMTVLHHVRMEKLQLKLRMEDNVESNSRALLWMAPLAAEAVRRDDAQCNEHENRWAWGLDAAAATAAKWTAKLAAGGEQGEERDG